MDVPVSLTPKPSWMHCVSIPPTQLFLSKTNTFFAPFFLADTAATSPAGPAPITATSTL